MSVAVSVTNLAQFNSLVRRARTELGKAPDQALYWGSIDIAKSCRSRARESIKKREVVKNPDYRQQARNRKKWLKRFGEGAVASEELFPLFILKYTQPDGNVERIGTTSKNDSRAFIHAIGTRYGKRGLAKLSWHAMTGKLGALKESPNVDAEEDVKGARRPPVKISKRRSVTQSGTSYVVNLINRIGYMERAFPGIADQAVAAANRSILWKLEENARKATAAAGY